MPWLVIPPVDGALEVNQLAKPAPNVDVGLPNPLAMYAPGLVVAAGDVP